MGKLEQKPERIDCRGKNLHRKTLSDDLAKNLTARTGKRGGTAKFGVELAKQLTKKPKKVETIKFANGLKLKIAKGKDLVPPKKHPEKWEYYDPNNSGNPLLAIDEKDLDKQISKHFKVRDYARIDAKDLQYVKAGTYWTVKSGNNVEYYHKYARIDPRLVALIENIRSDAGVPMIVNEGFRSYLENKRMYDNRNEKPAYGSRHVSGQALDFENTNNKILKSALYLMRNDGGIGLYPGKNAVHFDCRRSKRRWTKGQWDKNKEWPRERWLSKNDVQEVKDRIAGKKRKRKKK